MELTTAIRERMCRDGGVWTRQAITGAFQGARIDSAMEWLVDLGLVVSPHPGAYQAVDRWCRPIPAGGAAKAPEYSSAPTPGRDKGAITDGLLRLSPLSDGAPRAAMVRRKKRDKILPQVLDMLRAGVSFRVAMERVGYSRWLTPKNFPEWRGRITEAIAERGKSE